MDHYRNSLKLTLKEWILGTCIFIKFHSSEFHLSSLTLFYTSPCRRFLIYSFLSSDSMILFLLSFVYFQNFSLLLEFCWEARLLTPILCPCDSFSPSGLDISLHLFSYLCVKVMVMLWLLFFSSCSDNQNGLIYQMTELVDCFFCG